jgi:RNA polymerase sigma-70 factor (ECF subfamily)
MRVEHADRRPGDFPDLLDHPHIVRAAGDSTRHGQPSHRSRTAISRSAESEVSTWLHRIAGNFALMRLRKQKVQDKLEEPSAGPLFSDRGTLAESVADWHPNAEGNVLDAELRVAIQQATDALPQAHRQVFLLRDVDGLSYEEITEITGESLSAVKSRLHRARLALRAAIDVFYAERET